ncbi:MAG TPA: hypothetical protein VLV78_11280 [Thermoanaerobaculia bacterium]|nr:hypothetical protein [Thermoanaerobaculia bacterium]
MFKVSFATGLLVVFAALALVAQNPARQVAPANNATVAPVFCVGGSSTSPLCGAIPHDVVEGQGYGSILAPGTQQDFDNFSWQSFVALNWPSDSSGRQIPKLSIGIDPARPRVWDYYKLAEEVFLANGAQPDPNYPSKTLPPIPKVCQATPLQPGETVVHGLAKIDDVLNIPDFFEEAMVDLPLIDRYGNFVVYRVSMNRTEFNDIDSNGWYNSANQVGKTIRFTPGEKNGASEGAIEVKSAWRVLQPGKDNLSRYFVRPMRVYVPAKHSATGQDFCTPTLQMGLIAMHIVHKGQAQREWVWSTFEHVDNAPLTTTPLPATATAPSGPCDVPTNAPPMSLFTPGCVDNSGKACIANEAPVKPDQGNWLWQTSQPYAKKYLMQGKYGTQVVRCSSIWDGNKSGRGTAWLNSQWQAKLAGTPFANYMLIGSQWQAQLTLAAGQRHADFDTTPPAPPFIQNTAAETYLQNASSFGMSACMQCHSGAQGAACEDSDMSFMLDRAQPPINCKKVSGHPLKKTFRSTMAN